MASEFNLDLTQGEFDAYPEKSTPPSHSDGIKEMVIALSAARTGRDIDDVRNQVNLLGEFTVEGVHRSNVIGRVLTDFSRDVKDAIDDTDLGKVYMAEIARIAKEANVEDDPAPEATDLLTYRTGDIWNEADKLGLSRAVGSMKRLDFKMQNTEVSFLSIVGDILDLIFSAPLDALTLAGFRKVDKVDFLRNQMSNPNITNEEYYELFDKTLNELDDAGWFQKTNYLFLAEGASLISEGGSLGSSATLTKAGTLLDIGFLGTGVVGTGRRIAGMFRNTTRSTALIGGQNAAKAVLVDGVSKPGSVESIAAGVAEETTLGAARLPVTADVGMVAPGARVTQDVERRGRIGEIFDELGFSHNVDPALFDAWRPIAQRRLEDDLDTKTRNRLVDLYVSPPDKNNNVFGTIILGTAKGADFKDLKAAERVLEANGGDGRIITRVLGDEKNYRVAITKNISTTDLIKPIDPEEIGRFSLSSIMIPFARAFGGNFLALPERLTALALRGEGVSAEAVRRISPIIAQQKKALRKGELQRIDEIFYALRDSERFADRRHAFNLSEFKSEWGRGRQGATPSKAAEDYYFTIVELNNEVWRIKADRLFKVAVDDGSEILKYSTLRRNGDTDEFAVIVNAVKKEDIPEGEVIFNPFTREEFALDKIGNKRVFKVARGGLEANGGRTAVWLTMENPNLRRVYHSDVFGYNAGGPRNYDIIRHFIKQSTTVELMNGKTVIGKARTFMGTATREEALKGANEINAIFIGLRKMIPGLETMSFRNAMSALEELKGSLAARDLIRLHGAWNNNISSVEEFLDFLRKHKMDPTKNVGIAAKDEVMSGVDDAGNAIFGALKGETYGETFEAAINLPKNSGPRRDQPILGYGGNFAETLSPLDGIQSDFLRAVHSRAFEAFGFQSINGWLEGAKPFITPASKLEISGLSPLQAMRKAEFGKGPTPEAAQYKDARSAILRTLGTPTKWDDAWSSLQNRAGEYVHGKGWNKLSKVIHNSEAATSPLQFLRGLTFDAFLGMLDPGQLIVQASQTVNIVAIVGPLRGFQAAVNHIPLRLAMRTDDAATILEIGRRASKISGINPQEFVRLVKWTKLSGRLNVGDEVAEVGGVSTTMAKSMVRKVREVGRFFFNEGEKVPRSAAITVAWREFGEQFPKLDPFEQFGINWITSRQNALTAGMTRANAAAWQHGPTSLPLQFMTYSSRMFESLFTDRLLTKVERLRLGTAQVAFWGASGIGLGSVFEQEMVKNGWDLDETTFELIRYGALDAGLNATLGTQAVFGGRLAMAEGFSDMIRNFGDGKFLEILGGPAGQLGANTFSSLWQIALDMTVGTVEMVPEDLEKFVRNATGPNKLFNAWSMFTMGEYLSRNDDIIVNGLSNTDTMLHILGGQIRDASFTFSLFEVMKDENDHLKEVGRRLGKVSDEARKAMFAEDFEKAGALMRSIGVVITSLEPHQRRKVYPHLDPKTDSLYNSLLNATINRNYGRLKQAQGEQ